MPTDPRCILAVGIFGRGSHIGNRIGILLRQNRAFSPAASAKAVAASTMALTALLLAASLAPRWIAFAQAPAFEVATIKLSQFGTPGPVIGISAGSIALTGFTFKQLMGYAWWLHSGQVLGTAGWTDSERFDIVAKPGLGHVPEPQLRTMLQALLVNRFHLTFHHDMKVVPAYTLATGPGGPKMKARAPGDGGAGFRLVFEGPRLPGRNASMAQLAFVLQTVALDRPVIDKTGLAGNFDFDLSWTPDETQFGGKPQAKSPDKDDPDLFTAIAQQLDLRLESRKDPVDVLVIDHVEKPDAN
jgi:uncharacterized protein (TIGR03435 family)